MTHLEIFLTNFWTVGGRVGEFFNFSLQVIFLVGKKGFLDYNQGFDINCS